jgi:cobalt/nickel transport system permease protein
VQRGFLDRYVQGKSPIHRLDPRLKLLATLCFVIATTSSSWRAWPALALLAGLVFGAILLSRVPLIEILKRSLIVVPFAGMVAVSTLFAQPGQILWAWHPLGWQITITDAGLSSFVDLVTKSWLSVLISVLLVATTPFPKLLIGLRALGVPGVLTAIISFTYRYLYVLADEAMRMQTAREARSAGTGGTLWWRAQVLGGMIGTLFIRSYERSERIYAAMLSRGFTGRMRSVDRLQWRAIDLWAALCWGLLLTSAVLLRHTPF